VVSWYGLFVCVCVTFDDNSLYPFLFYFVFQVLEFIEEYALQLSLVTY
jgi:hypothetical protein